MKSLSTTNFNFPAENFNYIFEYLYRKNERVGVILALKDAKTNTVTIGWSLCKRKLDKFNRDFGIRLALNRALKSVDRNIVIPHSIKKKLDRFSLRAQKYFKECAVVSYTNCISVARPGY